MPRFYISDSNRPGIRVPLAEYRKSDGTRQSDILNEAQAIARQRKNFVTPRAASPYRYWLFTFESGPVGGTEAVVLNELQFFDEGGTNRILGMTPTLVYTGFVGTNSVLAQLTNGVTTESVSSGTYHGYSEPSAGDGYLFDLGVQRTIRHVALWAPTAMSYRYYPAGFRVRAGHTSATTDFDTGVVPTVLTNGNSYQIQ